MNEKDIFRPKRHKRQSSDFSKQKEFEDNYDLNLMKVADSFQKRVENTVGKGETARYKQFLLLSQCFQKTYLQTCKNQGLFGKGLTCRALNESKQHLSSSITKKKT